MADKKIALAKAAEAEADVTERKKAKLQAALTEAEESVARAAKARADGEERMPVLEAKLEAAKKLSEEMTKVRLLVRPMGPP